jgi:hypothetical protein
MGEHNGTVMSKAVRNGKAPTRKSAKSSTAKRAAKRSSSGAARKVSRRGRREMIVSGPLSEALNTLSYFYS